MSGHPMSGHHPSKSQAPGDLPDLSAAEEWLANQDTAPARERLEFQHANIVDKKVCEWVDRRPCLWMWSIVFLLVAITAATVGSGKWVFSQGGRYDWTVTESPFTENLDALNDATDSADDFGAVSASSGSGDSGVMAPLSELDSSRMLFFMYEWEANPARSVFTPETVKSMCELENIMPLYKTYPDFCPVDIHGNCTTQPRALSNFFYAPRRTSQGIRGWDCKLLSAADIDSASQKLQDRVVDLKTRTNFGFFVSATALEDGYSNAARGGLAVGRPLRGYDNPDDRAAEQRQKYRDELFKPVQELLFERFNMEASFFKTPYVDPARTDGMQVKFFLGDFNAFEFDRIVNSDLVWTVAAVMFVFIYIWLHTTSLWLSAMAMLQILLSMPVAYAIYRFIFGVSYYTQLHVLVIFLVLGIGADDVFVFVDGWKQSAALSHNEYIRLLATFTRTKHAVFNTSFTTALSFVATAVSPIMPVSSFGIYASLAIVLNFAYVVTISPAAVIIWHRMFSKGKCCGCGGDAKRQRKVSDSGIAAVADGEIVGVTSPLAADGTSSEAGSTTGIVEKEGGAVIASDAGEAASTTSTANAGGDEAQQVPNALADSEPDRADAGEGTTMAGASAAAAAAGEASLVVESFDTPTLEAEATKEAEEQVSGNGVASESPPEVDTAGSVASETADQVEDGGSEVKVDDTRIDGAAIEATPVPAGAADADVAASADASAVGEVAVMLSKEEPPAPERKLRFLERIFSERYAPALLYKWRGYKVVALAIIAVFLVWDILAISWALQLDTPTSEEEWFPKDHMFTGIGDYMTDTFFASTGENYVTARMVWGISGIDRSEYVRWEPNENRGVAVYDSTFDLSSEASRQHILEACDTIRRFECDAPGCTSGTNPRTIVLDGLDGDVECFMESFVTWHENKYGNTSAIPTGSAFNDRLIAYRSATKDSNVGVVDGQVKFVYVPFKSSLLRRQPFGITVPVRDEMERMVSEINAKAPDGVKTSFVVAGDFTWSDTEGGLIKGMFLGFAICFPVAFVVLMAATKSLVIAFFAIMTIAGIVASVLGFVQHFLGWALGIGESIAAVIVIGFSVDYVVHLGHMYAVAIERSAKATRAEAVKFAAETMGVTVVAGGITTLGAGAFMLLCQLTFFNKMAVLITLTISFSLLSSLGLFMALLAVGGPHGDHGLRLFGVFRLWM